MNLNEKLRALSSQEPSGWLRKAEERKQNRNWQKRSAAIALRILRELRYQGLTQRELASRMGVSAQQVNKIVKGQENMTLDTLDRLENALNIHLLYNDKAEQGTVLDFGSIDVEQKHSLMRQLFQQGLIANTPVFTIASFKMDLSYEYPSLNDQHLHKRYPIPGKEKWLQLHTEHS